MQLLRPAVFVSAALLTTALSPTLGAQRPSVDPYGTGSAGAGGFVPEQWVTETPRPGATGFGLTIRKGTGGSPAASLLAVGPFDFNLQGLRILVDPGTLFAGPAGTLGGSGAGNGAATLALPLPNLSSLIGGRVYSQVFFLDAGASSPLGLSATQGVEIAPTHPGMLVACTSVQGSTDPQYSVNLATGTVTDFSGGVVNNAGGATLVDGSSHVAMIAMASGPEVVAFDATTLPPVFAKRAPLTNPSAAIAAIRAHPDGQRLYTMGNGPLSVTPVMEVLNADPGNANFLQPHAGGGFSLPGLNDGIDFAFDGAGDFAYLAINGFITNAPGLIKFDTKTGSPTYHQNVGSLSTVQLAWALAVPRDGARVYLHTASLFGNTGQVTIVDSATMTAIDVDPGTPGVQSIGDEQSFPRTPIKDATSMAIGPLGRVLYLAGFTSIARVVVDPSDPNFLDYTEVPVTGGSAWGLAVTDAGDRVYVGQDGNLFEFDADLTPLRSWTVGSFVNKIVLR